jgi:hypothetical protein
LKKPLGRNQQSKIINQQLFHFFMRRVLAATVAEFLEFQPVRCRLAIFRGRVVALLALSTL